LITSLVVCPQKKKLSMTIFDSLIQILEVPLQKTLSQAAERQKKMGFGGQSENVRQNP
jgi:hypothetical protein